MLIMVRVLGRSNFILPSPFTAHLKPMVSRWPRPNLKAPCASQSLRSAARRLSPTSHMSRDRSRRMLSSSEKYQVWDFDVDGHRYFSIFSENESHLHKRHIPPKDVPQLNTSVYGAQLKKRQGLYQRALPVHPKDCPRTVKRISQNGAVRRLHALACSTQASKKLTTY